MNDEEKGDKARRMDIVTAQADLSPWMSFMPTDCVCPYCGFDFIDYPKAYKEFVTGCPSCYRSYCE